MRVSTHLYGSRLADRERKGGGGLLSVLSSFKPETDTMIGDVHG